MSDYKEIGSFIDRTYKVVRQDLINRFKSAKVNITPEQWVILSKLGEKDMFQTDLASFSFRDKPTVSRIVDLLVQKKLVERVRDKMDGRKHHVRITPKGNNVIRKATPAVEASRKLGWTNLSEKEYETLIATLDKIFANYSEHNGTK
ncbi:MarR family winged helix-turn-helix transcriptional regulator [Ekhidna sp.]|uniref:MarR family winged helix-turn-helix transcriptional regulator n=1 Tax=Ekhidna sp. TaxID=2608089 RepID=UPI0032ED8DD9